MAGVTAQPAPARPRPLLRPILIGLAVGVATGIFLGDRARIFQVAADAFVKLLQMAVLPYVTISVITSIGALRREDLRTVGGRVVLVLAALWTIALLCAFLIPLTFPPHRSGAFFSTTLVEQPADLDLVGLYIPANPFFALANNIVPAVVLFSIAVGAALIGVAQKQSLLSVLAVAGEALSRTMRFVTRLTPYGIFAIAAATAGTLKIEEAGRLQIYLLAFAALALVLALWVLPGLVSALTPIRARDIFRATREPLITATVAGDLFIVLPALISASKELIARCTPERPGVEALPDAIIPVTYNFPHSGKLLSVSFILFAGWFSGAPIDPAEYPRLGLVCLVSLFGSITAAMPFLLDLFRVPADTFQLYVATSVINSRLGSLVAAMHTVAIALLGSCAVSGLVRWRTRAVTTYLAATAAVLIVVVGGTRLVAAHVLGAPPSGADVLDRMRVAQPAEAAVSDHAIALTVAPATSAARSRLQTVTSAGTLRVGYLSDALPYAFFNGRDELVGFDVALMHALARELGVRLAFLPLDRSGLDRPDGTAALLNAGACDIVIGGLAITTTRAALMQLSSSYLSETLAFLVPDAERRRFATWDALRERHDLTVTVPPSPYFADRMRELLPRARVVPVHSTDTVFGPHAPPVEALMMPAERGSAWTLRYPQYAVVVPSPGPIKVPLAFALARGETELTAFVNTWIGLKRDDGTLDGLFRSWILGRSAAPPAPRWSIIRDVLHWVD